MKTNQRAYLTKAMFKIKAMVCQSQLAIVFTITQLRTLADESSLVELLASSLKRKKKPY